MMVSMHVLLVGTLAFGAQAVAALGPPPEVPHSANALVNQGKNPYTQIFRAPQRGAIPQPMPPRGGQTPEKGARPSGQNTQPRVVCGTVVVPVRPDADAKMIVRPKDTGAPQPEYRIRKIAPTICNE